MTRQLVIALGLSLPLLSSALLIASVPADKIDTAKQLDGIISSLSSEDDLSPEELSKIEMGIEALSVGKPDDKKMTKEQKEGIKKMSVSVKAIVNKMIPRRERLQKEDQKQLDLQVEAIKKCAADKQNASSSDLPYDQKQAMKEGVVDHSNCASMEEGKKLVRDAYCYEIDTSKACTSCGGAAKACDKKCCEANAAFELEKAKCAKIQKDLKAATAGHKDTMKDVCAKYDQCYNKEHKAYQSLEERVKKNEKFRNLPALYKMKCLLVAIEDGKTSKDESKACKEKMSDAPKIKYPKVPEKESC